MHSTQEEQDLEDGRNSHGRQGQIPQVALKPGTKLVDARLFALSVVEEGEKGGEEIRDGGGPEVVCKDLEHLKTLSKIFRVGVLEKVLLQAVLEGHAELALPELTGERVPSVGDQEQILAGSGETRRPEPEEEEVP